eukprot:TRINITY_DN291_c0_g1_i2.p1 TRINITY_DN291_c0_g1~~TRINITY_DN291_c0_g1_i2.p1  ORF type:complete len:628 (+),score=196.21 TRINITY_DN291_c0_g1_i2:111-1886(+)
MAEDLVVRVYINDYDELGVLLENREFPISLSRELTAEEALHKIANRGDIHIISSNYSFAAANFELVQDGRVFPNRSLLKNLDINPSEKIILRKKEKKQVTLQFEIEDHAELHCAMKVNVNCYRDQTVGETLHKIARKGNVFIPVAEEPEYALFFHNQQLEMNKTLESFHLQNKDVLVIKKSNSQDLTVTVMIEAYKDLSTPRSTGSRLKKEQTVGEALQKIASKGSVSIPQPELDYYELYLIENNGTEAKLDKHRRLSTYEIHNKDILLLRRNDEAKTSSAPAKPLAANKIDMSEITVTEKIGQGSSAKVLRGIYKGIEVAVKQLKETTEDEKFQASLKEFTNEVDILRKNETCPYIVRFFGLVEAPKLAIVMELCSRGSLYHVMNNIIYDIGWDRIFKVAIEIFQSVAFLHAHTPQIVHRDLKSLNLLVTENFDIKLCDFGTSRFKTALNMDTMRKLRGTAVWNPPEILREYEYTALSDVYSIGIILWELNYRCINGRYQRPFAEFKDLMFDYQILVSASKGQRPSLPPTTPAQLQHLIKSCWNSEHTQRPSSQEVLDVLTGMQRDYERDPRAWDSLKVEPAASPQISTR